MFLTFRFFNRWGKSRCIHPSNSVILKSKVQAIHMEEQKIKSDMQSRNHMEKGLHSANKNPWWLPNK